MRSRHRTVDGHRPEPAHTPRTAAGLVDASDIPPAAVDGVIEAVDAELRPDGRSALRVKEIGDRNLPRVARFSRHTPPRMEIAMKALTWHGKGDMRCEAVPDPKIEDGRDAIIKVTACAICGSDLHIFDGVIPSMESGDVLGHETMGEVVEVGSDNKALKVGDRVVVPFTISCGQCFFCQRGFYSGCERSNPNAKMAEKLWGHSPAGLFGYSHLLGGYAGGQAEYLRVPFADVGPIKVPEGLTDDQVLFLSDIFPTGYMAAEFCNIQQGDTIAVWGAGPVGQFAIASAKMLGAERIIAIDRFEYRLRIAREKAGATDTINYEKVNTLEALKEMTG